MKPIAWSHSAMSDFLNCPKQFYHKRIAKDVVDTQGEAALWGDRVHMWFEAQIAYHTGATEQAVEALARLTGTSPELAEVSAALQGLETEFGRYQGFLTSIFKNCPGQILAERQYAIDKALRPCDWFGPQVWCRGIIDVLHLNGDFAEALDWKTGKRKPNSKQLKLFALMVFIHHPEVQTCKTEFVWLATMEKDEEVFHRSQEAELWQEFLPDLARYNAAFKQEMWLPRKSGLCRGWCPVTTCEFWEPKKEK